MDRAMADVVMFNLKSSADIDAASSSSDGEGGVWFDNDAHQTGVLEMMKLMYDSRQLTDVCMSVDDRQFHCHRAVLAATSRYFRNSKILGCVAKSFRNPAESRSHRSLGDCPGS